MQQVCADLKKQFDDLKKVQKYYFENFYFEIQEEIFKKMKSNKQKIKEKKGIQSKKAENKELRLAFRVVVVPLLLILTALALGLEPYFLLFLFPVFYIGLFWGVHCTQKFIDEGGDNFFIIH